MKMKLLLFCLLPLGLAAQDTSSAERTKNGKNVIKLNVSSLAMRTVSLQYERRVGKHFSVALGYRLTPEGKIPFEQTIVDLVDDPSVQISQMRTKGMAITPELRYYFGKKMKGFYLAPYARWSSTEAGNLPLNFTYNNLILGERNVTATFSGKLSGLGGGLMLGAQFTIAKTLNVDIWLLGAHVGSGNGDLNAVFSEPLPPEGQQELRDQLEELKNNLEFLGIDYTVGANSANVTFSRFAGVRAAGITLGIRF